MLALPPPTAEELPALREEIALLEEALRLCDELPCADDSSSDGSGGSSREEGDSGSGEVGPMDGAGGAAVLHREATEAQAAPAGEPASKQRVAEQPLSDGDGREGGRQLPARKRRKSSPGHGLPATGNQPAVHLCGDAGPQPNGGHNSAPSGEGRHLAARSARSSAEVVPIAAQAVGDEAGEEPEGAVLDEDSATDDDLAHQQFERLPAGRPAPGQRPQPQQKQELGWKGGSGAPAARGAGGAPRAVAPPPLPGLQEHERRQDAEQAQRGDQQEGQEEEEPSPLEQEEGRQLQGNHGANSPALLRAAATDSTELSQRCLEPDCDGSCAEGGPGADAGARSDMELLLQETAPEQVVPSAGGVSAGPSNGRAAVTAAALQVGQAVGRAAVAGPDSNPGGKGSGKAHDAYTFLPSSSSSSSEDSEEELARLQRRRRGHRAFAGQRDSADLKQPAQVGEAGTAPPAVQQFSRKGRGWTAQAAQAEGLASVCNLFNPASPDAPPAAGLASAGGADDGPSAAPRATDGCRFVVVSLGAGQGAEEAAIRARLRQLASSLGGCVVEEHVSNRTTHVLVRLDERGLLAGRTMKALLGLAGGCWLLSCVWLNACAEAGEWLPERPYEAQGGELEQSKRPVCGGPHRCRVRRGAQGCGLLAGRRMHVAGPPAATAGGPGGTTQGSTQAQAKQRADIERLLEMAEAEVVRGEQTAEKEADVDVVAPWGSTAQLKAQFGRRLVSSRWVFDSLISGEERSMRDYRLPAIRRAGKKFKPGAKARCQAPCKTPLGGISASAARSGRRPEVVAQASRPQDFDGTLEYVAEKWEKTENKTVVGAYIAGAALAIVIAEWAIHLPLFNFVGLLTVVNLGITHFVEKKGSLWDDAEALVVGKREGQHRESRRAYDCVKQM
eukprot:scaffold6.g2646.t1